MNEEGIRSLLDKKEGTMLEFKKAKSNVPDSMWETVCSMLNRNGGDLLLGVDDDGTIVGVDEDKVDTMINNIVNQSNDINLINPTFILFPEKYLIDGKWIIYIPIPQSSQVYKHQGAFFDRSDDADIKIKNSDIHKFHNKKAGYYSENRVFPYLKFEDFSTEVFDKIRILIKNNKPSHLWLNLSDEEILRNGGFYQRDFESGVEGYTLAAALIFGKDTTIRSIAPHYSIDARVKINELEDLRFDDRIIIKTNLIDTYEQLMTFVEKHLPDPFYLEGDQRISLRAKIFREVVANIIVHREYSNAAQSTLIIYRDRVETINASTPLVPGPLNLNEISHHPKNPTISDFFMQLGLVEKMGSGAYYVSKYINHYSGRKEPAQFIDGSVFKMIIPRPLAQNVIISDGGSVQTGVEVGIQTGDKAGVQTGAEIGVQTGAEAGVQTGAEIDAHRSIEVGDKPSMAYFHFARKEKQDNTNPTKNYQWMIFRGKVVKAVENAYKLASAGNKNINIPSSKNTGKVADLLEFIGMKESVTREEIYEFLDYNSKSPVDRIISVLTNQDLIDNPGGSRNKTYSLKGEIKELIEGYYKK